MRVLFATNHSYLPQRFGGSESSTHDMALELIEMGHEVAIMASLEPVGRVFWLNRIKRWVNRRGMQSDRILGYPVYRDWPKDGDMGYALRTVVSSFRPDILCVQAGKPLKIAAGAEELGLPCVVYLRDISFDKLGGIPGEVGGVHYVANSTFTAERFAAETGMHVPPAIPPLIRPDQYRVHTTREKALLINPNKVKGVDVALALAELRPDVQFVLQESWPLTREFRSELCDQIADRSNVSLRSATTNMAKVYGQAKVLLAPSQIEEAWGRVITEAQISGIPALASDIGGLPESVGKGGIILPCDAAVAAWAEAFGVLWDDSRAYDEYSMNAVAAAGRVEIQPRQLARRFLRELEYCLDARH